MPWPIPYFSVRRISWRLLGLQPPPRRQSQTVGFVGWQVLGKVASFNALILLARTGLLWRAMSLINKVNLSLAKVGVASSSLVSRSNLSKTCATPAHVACHADASRTVSVAWWPLNIKAPATVDHDLCPWREIEPSLYDLADLGPLQGRITHQ